jgi:chromate reductase
MNHINTLVLTGGISRESLNRRLFHEVLKHYQGKLSLNAFEISGLPFFSQDIENSHFPVIEDFKNHIHRSKAVLFVTPEYNRSMPGVLKNALDWGSRPHVDNCWDGKPAAIMGASTGSIGTYGAQEHLRTVCSFLNMRVMSQPEFYMNAAVSMNEHGLVESSIPFVQKFLNCFEEWISLF